MSALPTDFREPHTVAALGGVIYAIVVLFWLFSSGVQIADGDIPTMVFAYGYAVAGMFLTAAVPLYLFTRFSLVSSPLVTLLILGDTVYQWQYGTHLHPLSSYIIVWPLLLSVALLVTLAEAILRISLDRTIGRLGLRSIV